MTYYNVYHQFLGILRKRGGVLKVISVSQVIPAVRMRIADMNVSYCQYLLFHSVTLLFISSQVLFLV